jgi:Domain of unknown function (DUF1844)
VDTPEEALSFSHFILSLGTTAAIHFGDLPDPTTGEVGETNLEAASQMIELISMLQEKTRGNLEPAESKLLEDLLYDLRMRFVQAQQQPRVVLP